LRQFEQERSGLPAQWMRAPVEFSDMARRWVHVVRVPGGALEAFPEGSDLELQSMHRAGEVVHPS
jgi:hypothetical protein